MQVELAANVVQAIKAKATGNTGLLFDALPESERCGVIRAVAIALKSIASGAMSEPADLHAFNCSNLERQGWTHGAVFRPLKQQTPLLRPYHALPGELRDLIANCFEVLRAAAKGELEFAGRNAPTGNFYNNNPNGVSR
jgi:hypothetical protein